MSCNWRRAHGIGSRLHCLPPTHHYVTIGPLPGATPTKSDRIRPNRPNLPWIKIRPNPTKSNDRIRSDSVGVASGRGLCTQHIKNGRFRSLFLYKAWCTILILDHIQFSEKNIGNKPLTYTHTRMNTSYPRTHLTCEIYCCSSCKMIPWHGMVWIWYRTPATRSYSPLPLTERESSTALLHFAILCSTRVGLFVDFLSDQKKSVCLNFSHSPKLTIENKGFENFGRKWK